MSWLRLAGKRVCAWCGKDMGEAGFDADGDTHGMCPECKAMHFHEAYGDPLPEGVTEEQFRAWLIEVSRRQVKGAKAGRYDSWLSPPVELSELPAEYQSAVMEYMAEGVAPEDLEEWSRQYLYRAGEVPTETLVNAVMDLNQQDIGDRTFSDYHKDYLSMGNMPDHSEENRWPVVLDEHGEFGAIEDGWHRFHDYVRKGATSIPSVMIVLRE